MKTKFVLILMLVLSGLLAGCQFSSVGDVPSEIISGSGNVVTEEREASGFTSISLQGVGNVIVDLTGSESLSVTADDNFLPYLETEVRGDTLVIRIAEGVAFNDVTDLTFNVAAAELDSVELSGAGNIEVQNVDTDNWSVKVPGAGSLTVSGQATRQTVEIRGAGSYNAEDLATTETTVKNSGAGSAVVRVSDKLDVTIDGLGNVQYIGNPTVTKEINGLGNVSQQ